MCGAKMVHAFAVLSHRFMVPGLINLWSSVVRGYHEYKDIWQPLRLLQLLLSAAEFRLMLGPLGSGTFSSIQLLLHRMEVLQDLD